MHRQAAKLEDGFRCLSHSKKLKKLPSMIYRKDQADIIEMFKYFYFLRHLYINKNFRKRVSKNHDYLLVLKAPRDDVRKLQIKFFYFLAIQTCNELPEQPTSIDSSKNKLYEHCKNLPIKIYEQ